MLLLRIAYFSFVREMQIYVGVVGIAGQGARVNDAAYALGMTNGNDCPAVEAPAGATTPGDNVRNAVMASSEAWSRRSTDSVCSACPPRKLSWIFRPLRQRLACLLEKTPRPSGSTGASGGRL